MMTNPRTILNRDGLKLAYDYGEGHAPVILFLSGFRSDMLGTKAQFIKQQCIARGQSYLLLDYSGHGQSEGAFKDGTIGSWFRDACDVIDAVLPADAPLLVMGSSMGGWIALHVSLKYAGRVRGQIGIASAPDFTRGIWNDDLDEAGREMMKRDGLILEPSPYGEPVPFTYKLITQGEDMCLMDRPINLTIPVTLIHGQADEDVPWKRSDALAQHLPNASVSTIFIKDGDHRLSRDQDLALIDGAVLDMLGKIG